MPSVSPDSTSEEIRDAILQVIENRFEDGNTYVKAKQVVDLIDGDVSTEQIGKHMQILEERGDLDRWSESSNGAVWKITLEDDREIRTDGGNVSGDAERATTDVDPAEMDDVNLHDEWDRVAGLLDYGGVAKEDDDELWDRRVSLWNEMKSRADAEAPECPECANQSWSQSIGGPKSCDECDLHLGSNYQDLIDRINDYWNTVRSVGAAAEQEDGRDD